MPTNLTASPYSNLIADDGRDNDGPIYQVDAGQEPLQFISYFKGWSEARAISGEDMYQRNLELLKKQEGVTLVDLAESAKPRRVYFITILLFCIFLLMLKPRVVSTSPVNSGSPSPLSLSASGPSSADKWHQYNPTAECYDYDRLKVKIFVTKF